MHNLAPSADCVDDLVELYFGALPAASPEDLGLLLNGTLRIVGREVRRVERGMRNFAALAAAGERARVLARLKEGSRN